MGNRANCCFHLVGNGIDTARVERFVEDLKAHLADAVPSYEFLEATWVSEEYVRVDFRVREGSAHKIGVPSSSPGSVVLFTWANEGYHYADEHIRCTLWFSEDREVGVASPRQFVDAVRKFAKLIGTSIRSHDQLISELADPKFPVEFLKG